VRVAIINHGIFPFLMGGMERHTHFLASHMAAEGAEVEVIVPELTPEQTAEFEAAGNPYKLVQFPWPASRLWLRSNYLFSKLAAPYLAAGGFDAVYCLGFSGWAYLAGKGPKAVTIYNPHGLEMFKSVDWKAKLKSLPMQWAGEEQARLADRTVSLGGGLTREVREYLRVPDSKIEVLPNAVDLDYIDGFPHGAKPRGGPARFVFVGRLEHNKGIGYLCEAFVGLPGAHLTIVGSGPLNDELRAKYTQPNIEFAGRLDDAELFARYHASDGFIFASLYEGMPTVILEAMACNLPVIATDIGAVTTMVDADNGFVVAPASSAQLADAVRAFLALPAEARAAMSEASRRRVAEHFTWGQIARQTLAAIARLRKPA
jgi:glycosyltransferase involved in cell wall biosynthesis